MPRRKPRTKGRRLSTLIGGLAIGALACALLTAPATAATGPTNLRMNPTPINGSGDNCGYLQGIGSFSTLDLTATVGEPNGPQVGAHFEVHEVGNGNPTAWDGGWTSEFSGAHTALAQVPGTALTDGKTYAWSVESGHANQPDPVRTAGCTFTYDNTRPGAPTVTSQDFPVNGGGKYAGQQGVFILDTSTAGPDVTAVEYSLNGPIPVVGAAQAIYDAPSGTWRTPALPVSQWGTNNLFAQTVDRAGNRSQQTTYSFYAPSNPNPPAPKPGDVTGDGNVDVLVVDADGALKGYNSATQPGSGGVLASATSEGPLARPDGGRTWTGALVSHRGGGGRADDLYVYDGRAISLYRNTLDPTTSYFRKDQVLVVNRAPRCIDLNRADRVCVGYRQNWSQVKQLLAVNDARSEFFTVEEETTGMHRLWLHSRNSPRATALDGIDRRNQEFSSPGDINGDGLADLWARDRTDGKVYQYTSAKNPDGTADLGAYSRTPTLIATGFDTTAYPQVSSDGDFDGDGKADLWARAANGNVYTYPGQAPDTNGNVFGPAQLIAGS
ncbi:FG-GAP repeat domain-containing protein [Embleya sp. NPDC050154]|uniref:FG-GAP repeat domain-containing protein n=1 Tax=unclassified Embleya TaxID=2699296 RepID=UPI0037957773